MSSNYAQDCIDAFCHFMPLRYYEAVEASFVDLPIMFERCRHIPAMVDLKVREEMLQEFPGYRQIISLPGPPPDVLFGNKSVELTRIANDELAQAASDSPGTTLGFVASLPMNNLQESTKEACRAVSELGAVGVQIYSSVGGVPLDHPSFDPLFGEMAALDRPILLHPTRSIDVSDYPTEEFSKYDLWWALGWPYETTVAMVRLALSGIFSRYRKLRILAHHVGGYLPMLAGRLGPGMQLLGTRHDKHEEIQLAQLTDPLLDACKSFYADTASFGSQAAIECGQAFFTHERLLFATDMPFDPGRGPGYIRSTLDAISRMDISVDEQNAILRDNAISFFQIPDYN